MSRDIDNYVANYSSEDHYSFEIHQVEYRRRNILEQIGKYPHYSILEVGCGTEPFFQFLNKFDKYTIVDPAEKFYNIAKSLSNKNKKIKIYNDFIENIDLEDKFDFVIISGLLHEVENPKYILESVKKYLAKDSVIYINVPNAKSFHRLLAYESNLIEDIYSKSDNQIRFQQSHTFDSCSLQNLVEGSGFSVISSGSYFIKPFTHKQMREMLGYNIISKKILDGLNGMIKYRPELGSEIYICCQINSKEKIKS